MYSYFNPYNMYQNNGYGYQYHVFGNGLNNNQLLNTPQFDVNKNQNCGYGYQYPMFMDTCKSNQSISTSQQNLNLQSTPDTISFKATEQIKAKQKKKSLSTGAKWGIGLGLTALVAGGIYLATKGRAKNLDKLFDEKMVLSNLPENLTYKKAETVEEGIKYAKEVLKIQNVDSNFSLEGINYVNKSLVDVSNANKGKLLMPKSLRFEKLENSTIADMCHNIKGDDFAQLRINSDYFDESFLDDKIKRFLKIDKYDLFKLDDKGNLILSAGKIFNSSTDLNTLAMKYLHNKPMTINEKRTFLFSLTDVHSKIATQYVPNKKINIGTIAPETKIYHEMGHLQDYFVNLKNLMKVNSILDTTKIDNRYLRKRDLKTGPLKDPNTLKDLCPDLYEHINNKSIQDIAGQVSRYSQEGIGEFVAEVYSGLISGKTFSDDVMSLYKKYGGPALNK